MKLLIVTQVVDSDDIYLGFFTRWIAALAPNFERIEIICLKEGNHTLPENVRVYSLGKERGVHLLSRLLYMFRFYRYVWQLRHEYDAVFVHMNQEYVLLAGLLWKVLRKRIYMWRNHYAGSFLTDVAAWFCTHVFCTSTHSYTAKYKKTVLMPVGVDTERFSDTASVARVPHSILFFARMSPSKDPLVLVEALRELRAKNAAFTATFAGSPLPEHEAYYRSIVGRAEHYGLNDVVTFIPGIPHIEAPALYQAHEIYVNAARSGMFDKTLFEAAASGCLVLARSDDYAKLAGTRYAFNHADELALRLEEVLSLSEEERGREREHMHALAESQSLTRLVRELVLLLS